MAPATLVSWKAWAAFVLGVSSDLWSLRRHCQVFAELDRKLCKALQRTSVMILRTISCMCCRCFRVQKRLSALPGHC